MTTAKKNLQKKTKKRNSLRFSADPGDQAFVLKDDEGVTLKKPLPALLVEESFKGCSLVVIKNSLFFEGAKIQVKVGKLDPLFAEVRWIKTFDSKISFIGLSYLD